MSLLSLSFLLFVVNSRSDVSVKFSLPPIKTPIAIATPTISGVYFF